MNMMPLRFPALLVFVAAFSFTSCKQDPSTEPPEIALTFDDGPDSLYTLQILDILKEKKVKAAFFVIGKHIRMYPEVVKRILQEGHSIGNHTYSHIYMASSSDSMIDYEVSMTQHLIDSLDPGNLKYFRAPWGAYTPVQMSHLEQQGYKNVSWNIDTKDYESSTEQIVSFVLEHRQKNGIVLMHSADYTDTGSRENTVRALPLIIDQLRDNYHYNLVGLKEVLK
jgi:peptidoglycan-N-acetylglucosamine deacetylase